MYSDKYVSSTHGCLDAMNEIEMVAPYTLVEKLRTISMTHGLLNLMMLNMLFIIGKFWGKTTPNSIIFSFTQYLLVILYRHICVTLNNGIRAYIFFFLLNFNERY